MTTHPDAEAPVSFAPACRLPYDDDGPMPIVIFVPTPLLKPEQAPKSLLFQALAWILGLCAGYSYAMWLR